ncbi:MULTISPECIES: hypothetical protein [Bacillus]|uniref:Uncharacterized protein n=1 Tax=Bacillus amyloliquefaciens TaxID=1390 RepID=A0AAP3YB17_BACAM|nr:MULTISPECIES: hypothetical protein [Bacillus]APA03063.1 hypothetical protein BK055_11190 [Bacillus velezensis]ASK58749.1 hypothetical protein CFN60_10280 [Bacillus velezensis]ATU27085.1 hypothetical protein BMJ37_10145 [Bacillus velezensis]ATV23108.1 hypothetical protein CS547_10335 [Bacillus sp. Lzh-5]AUS15762.1 hypothetical protein C0W57_05985 [Bacillus velezensis]
MVRDYREKSIEDINQLDKVYQALVKIAKMKVSEFKSDDNYKNLSEAIRISQGIIHKSSHDMVSTDRRKDFMKATIELNPKPIGNPINENNKADFK